MKRALAGGLAVALVVAAILLARPAAPPPADGPNLLILVWDTVRADRTTLYGHDRDTTPGLVAFAEQGIVFDRAVSPAMWTPPSHASMFTGLAPQRHGVTATYKWLDHHHTTLAEIVRDRGWDTFAFSANPYVADTTNITQGFDTVTSSSTAPWRSQARKATQAKLDPEDASTDISPAWPGKRVVGDVHPFKDAGPVAQQALLDWLGGRDDGDKPWFAFVNLMEAHIPRIPSRASREALLDPETLERGLKTNVSQIEMLAYTFGKREYTPAELEAIRGVYDASVRDLDAATFAMIDALEAAGHLDDTIVVLTADHGEHLGEHHMFGHKFSLSDTLLHVPLVLWAPERLTPRRVPTPVSNLHLFATLLDLLGLPVPTDIDATQSLLDIARPLPLFSELTEATPVSVRRIDKTYGLEDKERWFRRFQSIELDGFKLIAASDFTHTLHDLVNDPGETRDVKDDHADRFHELEQALAAWDEAVPDYDPDQRTEADTPTAVDAKTRRMLQTLGYVEEADEDTERD